MYQKILSGRERKYCTTEKEAFAVIFGIRTFRTYLLGRPFQSINQLKCPCHKMRVYIFEIYDTKYMEIRKQNRNCFFSVKVIAV
jgi:hypothetical protein